VVRSGIVPSSNQLVSDSECTGSVGTGVIEIERLSSESSRLPSKYQLRIASQESIVPYHMMDDMLDYAFDVLFLIGSEGIFPSLEVTN
jgi:hypothetical protein